MGAVTTGRICVTGAGGQAGRAVVRDLLEHGYDVAATDLVASRNELEAGMLRADLADYGQALEALEGAEAVIHLANVPAPGLSTPSVTFNANVAMNFNVFHAAARLRLRRVVWASSETTLGLFFGIESTEMPYMEADGSPPRYAPVDEDHYPLATTAYALSKVASETIAGQIAIWSGIPFVALRFSNIMAPGDYEEFPSFWADPHARKWNLWSYVDARDVAAACRLSLEVPPDAVAGSTSFIIAAADTVMTSPSSALLADVFPGVPLTRDVGVFGSLLAIDRARQVLGYEPQHSWRDHVPAP
jgi:nucleoside-diphosphate-sugar epimerase